MGLVDQQRDGAPLCVGEVLSRLECAVEQLQEEVGDEDRVVLADGGLGAGDDEDLAAREDAVDVERYRVAQEGVDLAGGDQSLDLVAGWVEGLGGVAAVGDQGGEFAVSSSPWRSVRRRGP